MSHALLRCNYRCNGGFQHQPFRPLFLFVPPAFYRRQPWSKWSTCYDTFHTLEEKNTQEMWCKKKNQVLNLKTLEQELEFFLWTILLLSLLLLLFHEKDIENVYLFLNIVSLFLSLMHGVILLAGQFLLFRVYIMDIPLWIMLASFLHRSINSWERYAYDDEV